MDLDQRQFRHVYFEDTGQHIRMAISIGKNSHGEDIIIERPNMVALYLSISSRAIQAAEAFYESFSNNLNRKEGSHVFPSTPEGTKAALDYLESICIATIFSYSAAEAFANSIIPDNYVRKTTKRGTETLDTKEDIERHYSLRDKYKIIIPEIHPNVNPQSQPLWSKFAELEQLRDGLVHLKMNESLRFTKERIFLRDFIFKTNRLEPYRAVPELIRYVVQNMGSDCASIPYEFQSGPFSSTFITDML